MYLKSTVNGSGCVALVQSVPCSFYSSELLHLPLQICLCLGQMLQGQQSRSSQRRSQGVQLGSPPGPSDSSQRGQLQASETLK